MKKQQKDCLGNECEEIDIKMAEIINNKCDPSHISNFKRIYSLYTVGQHQKPTENPPRHVLSNFLAKKNKAMVF